MVRKFYFKKKLAYCLLGIVVVMCFSGGESRDDYSLAEALRVIQVLEKIQSEGLREESAGTKKTIVTESELNSYIAYRIEAENEEIMRELRLKLFDGNRVEGKIRIDLTGQNLPRFLKPRMDFYFAGRLQTRDGRAKIEFQQLFLESQPVQPVILDLVIFLAAKKDDVSPSSINDWYDLPFGIKRLEVRSGLVEVLY